MYHECGVISESPYPAIIFISHFQGAKGTHTQFSRHFYAFQTTEAPLLEQFVQHRFMLENQLKTKTLSGDLESSPKYSLYILVSHPICIHQTLIPKIDKMVELFNHLSPKIQGEITFLHTNCYINSSIVLISHHRNCMVHLYLSHQQIKVNFKYLFIQS